VKEYSGKFMELDKFEMGLIDTPMKKAMKFITSQNSLLRELILA